MTQIVQNNSATDKILIHDVIKHYPNIEAIRVFTGKLAAYSDLELSNEIELYTTELIKEQTKYNEELNAKQRRCDSCNELLTVGVLTMFKYGVYCADCLPTQQEDYERTCQMCGVIFETQNKGSTRITALCVDCFTPELLKELKRVNAQFLRAQNAGNSATLTLRQWMRKITKFDSKCAYCQVGNFEVMEHFIPVSLGGGTTENNCYPCCYRCNTLKGNSIYRNFNQIRTMVLKANK